MIFLKQQENQTRRKKNYLTMSIKKPKRFPRLSTDNYGQPMGPFDRSIGFTCFNPWVESIRQQYQTDPAKAALAFLVLADYCLYGIEPDPITNPWGMAWPSIKQGADSSIKNRSRRFGTEDIEKQEKIKDFHLENPAATQREIAEATSCSLGLVNKVVKRLRNVEISSDCSIDYNSNSNPRGAVLEQNPIQDDPAYEDPALEEVLGPHQPDAAEKENSY